MSKFFKEAKVWVEAEVRGHRPALQGPQERVYAIVPRTKPS